MLMPPLFMPSRDLQMRIGMQSFASFIVRQINVLIDLLDLVIGSPMGMSFFDSLPPLISLDFLADASGTYCPRMISL